MKYHCLAALVVFGGATLAQAQLEIAGSASGLFDGVSTSYGGLTYSDSTFDVFPAFGFFAFGGNPGPPNFNNLGSFMLSPTAFDYSNPPTTFTLDVDFTTPTGIVTGQTTDYMASLTGHVIDSTTGGVFIDFGSTPQTFVFDTSSGHGMFTLAINPLAIYPGQNASLTGFGSAAFTSVPAPAAVACMSLGLIGALRRRRPRKG